MCNLEKIAAVRTGKSLRSSASASRLRPLIAIHSRSLVSGAIPCQGKLMQSAIEPGAMSDGFQVQRRELSCSCSSSSPPWSAQQSVKPQGSVPGDRSAASFQETQQQDVDSTMVTSKLQETKDKQTAPLVLATSGTLAASNRAESAAALTRWEFLKSLRHRLIRDIAFVIGSPQLLQDSDELRTVSSAMLGGDGNHWPQSAHWLMGLDGDSVTAWFEARSTRNRLGDHFALCVEYVLKFLPSSQIHGLVVSQQVLEQERMVDKQPTSALCISPAASSENKNCSHRLECSSLDENGVLCTTGGAQFRVENMASTGDVAAETSLAAAANPLKNCTTTEENSVMRSTTGAQLSENMPSTAGHVAETTLAAAANPSLLGRRKKRMIRKLQRAAAHLGVPRTVGEFDFLFQLMREGPAANEPPAYCTSEECLHPGGKLSGVSGNDDGVESLGVMAAGQEVQHWEVSVKFLLYTGPWEPFGLRTPELASWSKIKRSQENRLRSSESGCAETYTEEYIDDNDEGDDEEVLGYPSMVPSDNNIINTEEVLSPDSASLQSRNQGNNFFGCFLGPHVGESLAEKKNRLCTQLGLSNRAEGSTLIQKLFAKEEDAREEDKSSPEVIQQQGCTGNKILEVSPRALLTGYLFYEYHLWCILKKGMMSNTSSEAQKKHDERLMRPSQDPEGPSTVPTHHSLLNPEHWMGWWCRIHEFVHIPFKRDSRWYIVPKLEWLSPVVIEGTDEQRCANVLDVPQFLDAAAKLSAEARERNIPRKRRVLLAEVRWEGSSPVVDCRDGQWVEASRGFVVEQSWPDSRLYQPHGFDLSWCPELVVSSEECECT